jgi:hypothetical protein
MCLYANSEDMYLATVVLPTEGGPVIAKYLGELCNCFSKGKFKSIAILLLLSKKYIALFKCLEKV